ncbi:MAG: AEC family transporter [Anderseniella sp.]|nr:AEC family transporter [Anderseniella sp.]
MAVFESILPIFALVIIGNIVRRTGLIPEPDWRGIELVCFWLLFPALLCITLARIDLATMPIGPLAITMLAMTGVLWGLLSALKPLLHARTGMDNAQFTSVFQAGSRFHGFIALAIVLKLFGEGPAAYVALIMAVLVPPINVVNIVVLATFGRGQTPNLSNIIRVVLKNPIIWGAVAGLLINLSGLGLWEPLETGLDLLGRAALGAGLLAVGAGLRVKAALKPDTLVWTGTIMKLAITPIVVIVLSHFTGLDGVVFEAAVITAAVPTAMNGYVLARTMGGDAELYAATATVQTALAFITIPAWIWIGRLILSGA